MPDRYPLAKAGQFTDEQARLLSRTVCRDASPDELKLFLYVCGRTGLDPFIKQIYFIKRYDYQLKAKVGTIQTAIDGYRLVAERTRQYAPGREPTFLYDGDKLVKATAYVKKLTDDGTWHEVAAPALYDEYVVTTKDGQPTHMWRTKRHIQLAKCAESLALRKAFPNELGGTYTTDEMGQAENMPADITVTAGRKGMDEELAGLPPPEDDSPVQQIRKSILDMVGCKDPDHPSTVEGAAAQKKCFLLTGFSVPHLIPAERMDDAQAAVATAYAEWKIEPQPPAEQPEATDAS